MTPLKKTDGLIKSFYVRFRINKNRELFQSRSLAKTSKTNMVWLYFILINKFPPPKWDQAWQITSSKTNPIGSLSETFNLSIHPYSTNCKQSVRAERCITAVVLTRKYLFSIFIAKFSYPTIPFELFSASFFCP